MPQAPPPWPTAQAANIAFDNVLAAEINALSAFGKAYEVTVLSTFLINGQLRTLAVLDGLPAGRYLVIAKAIVQNAIHDTGWHCRLLRNNDQFPNILDRTEATTESGIIDNSSNVTLTGIATLPAPGSFRVDCFTQENGSDLFAVKIVAVSVQP
jgi:hypothetical protein